MPEHPIYPLLIRAFLGLGKARSITKIPSKQLIEGLEAIELSDGVGILHIPHYWAAYVHDGRPPVTPQTASFLVWFKNPAEDPRYPGGRYPVYRRDIKRLSQAQFKAGLARNREVIKRYKAMTGKKVLTSEDYRAMDLPMIIAVRSPRAGTAGKQPGSSFYFAEGVPFFSNAPGGGMDGFTEECNDAGAKIFNRYIADRFQRLGILNKTIKQEIVI